MIRRLLTSLTVVAASLAVPAVLAAPAEAANCVFDGKGIVTTTHAGPNDSYQSVQLQRRKCLSRTGHRYIGNTRINVLQRQDGMCLRFQGLITSYEVLVEIQWGSPRDNKVYRHTFWFPCEHDMSLARSWPIDADLGSTYPSWDLVHVRTWKHITRVPDSSEERFRHQFANWSSAPRP